MTLNSLGNQREYFKTMKSNQFKTLEDIEEYFNNDEIECLVCGDYKKSLALHLKAEHEMTADEYRQEFGLPLGRGLIGRDVHRKLSNAARLGQEKGRLDIEFVEKNPNSRKGGRRSFSPAHMKKFQVGAQEYNESIRIEDKAFFYTLLAIKRGEKASKVQKLPGYPSSSAVNRYRKLNPKFDKVFTRALTHQAILRNKKIVKLSKEGFSNAEIYRKLKVAKNIIQDVIGPKERASDKLDKIALHKRYKASGLKPKQFCDQNNLTEHYESLRKKFEKLDKKAAVDLENESALSL